MVLLSSGTGHSLVGMGNRKGTLGTTVYLRMSHRDGKNQNVIGHPEPQILPQQLQDLHFFFKGRYCFSWGEEDNPPPSPKNRSVTRSNTAFLVVKYLDKWRKKE